MTQEHSRLKTKLGQVAEAILHLVSRHRIQETQQQAQKLAKL